MPTWNWTELLGRSLQQGRQWWSGLWLLEARLKGCEVGRNVRFVGRPLISVVRGSRLRLGDNVRIHSALRANPLGCFQPSVLRTLCPEAELILESQVGVSGSVLCAASSIHVGEGTIIGSGALILDTDFHHPVGEWGWSTDPGRGAKTIHIGRGVFVGARAVILKGVTIGDRAVIGASAVVTHDVPPRHFAFGNPAQVRPWNTAPESE